jgi:hypothetical protein
MSQESDLEARVQPLLVVVHLLLVGAGLLRSIPHHANELGGVLLHLQSPLGEVVELLHFGIHDALRHMVLAEGLSELFPQDAHGVIVGIIVAVPPSARSASELVIGDSHTLLINADGEVQLLLDLPQPVLGGDGVIVGIVEGRGPQIKEALQQPLEVI